VERLRQITAAGLAAAAFLPAAGCTGAQQSAWKTALTSTVAPSTDAAPATQLALMWQNRLAQLPDPTRNGAATSGITGQLFIYTADYKPAVPQGDLMVTVHDNTPRKPGQSAMPAEVWHFTKDTLAKMVVSDERYGQSLLLFLPWPDSWRDVNRLYIEARYVQGEQKLYAQPATVTLDMQAPNSGARQGGVVASSIPDPAVLLKRARSGGNDAWAGPVPAGQQPVLPAGGFAPQPPAGGIIAPVLR
jgi:hypothetical protein